jgi:hypothetical protein
MVSLTVLKSALKVIQKVKAAVIAAVDANIISPEGSFGFCFHYL